MNLNDSTEVFCSCEFDLRFHLINYDFVKELTFLSAFESYDWYHVYIESKLSEV